MRLSRRHLALQLCIAVWSCCGLLLALIRVAQADEPAKLTIAQPVPYQVVQRTGFRPRLAHEHEPGGPKLGSANVAVSGETAVPADAVFEFRVVVLDGGYGAATEWRRLTVAREGAKWTGRADVAAGGWYRLEIRVRAGGKIVVAGQVEPFGVGEVFVIAGQSYAEGANDERLKVEETRGRVVAFDSVKKVWRVAHDPQPNMADGGTIWPALGDLLVPLARVPIGFVNVAVGGTASRQWLPGTPLYQRLSEAGQTVGRFRAVLWQQGESDVIEKVESDVYVRNVTSIRQSLANEWGFEPPWLPAKSTLHPTVYNNPVGEGKIRTAIDTLWKTPGFRPGPDTDTLGGENRGGPKSRRHFTGIGQRRAALLWFSAVWNELQREE
ncbi:MAG: hypothetical protein HZA46_04395 [Planctomycetales bacterium]|nr:hypothetical protein [Planctomycetales bacterium]